MSSLESSVLVLNRLWQPVHVCGVRRALALLFVGHALVVDPDEAAGYASHDLDSWMALSREYEGSEVIHTVAHRIRTPVVIVLKRYDRFLLKEARLSRRNVLERDRYTCQYCGKRFEARDLNLDHVIPRDKGGLTTWENVVCSCVRCNTRKANKLPAQAGMFPLSEPKRPHWSPWFELRTKGARAHASWLPFVRHFYGEVATTN